MRLLTKPAFKKQPRAAAEGPEPVEWAAVCDLIITRKAEVLRFQAPTGLRLKAQGCPDFRATLGGIENPVYPEGVSASGHAAEMDHYAYAWHANRGHNSVGVGSVFSRYPE